MMIMMIHMIMMMIVTIFMIIDVFVTMGRCKIDLISTQNQSSDSRPLEVQDKMRFPVTFYTKEYVKG